ncbi:MAG: translation initiation factor IF-3 [Candidatus Moranbacteria bacterium]|nr:translation initiation factor IF-3 [Candidatus Moranbacteria bacterium]
MLINLALKRKPYRNFSKPTREKTLRVNHGIKAPKVRLIDEEGGQIGVVATFEAVNQAKANDLDLVEVVSSANPPVAKIMDYGKYQYIKKKQERKNKSKSRQNEVKGIRLGIKTEQHDVEIKRKRAQQFLKKGYKVSIEMILKGRERAYMNKAREVLSEFIKNIEVPVQMDQEIKKSPRGFTAVIKADK